MRAQYEQLLRTRGCKVTPQRLAIFTMLNRTKEHPSAEKIYQALHSEFPMMSLATVYKTLDMLREQGLVCEMGFGDDCNRYDADTHPHSHLICTNCKKILDLDLPDVGDLESKVAQTSGFRLAGHRLEFFGICPACTQ